MKQADIGIVGGGQLGRMMILEGHQLGLRFAVLDPEQQCPAADITQHMIEGSFNDAPAIQRLASVSRRMTFEFEHINAETLMELESSGCQVMPSAETLHMVQNKFRQKTFLAARHLPVPEFCRVDSKEDVLAAAASLGLPLLLKRCTGGYDGKGNILVSHVNEIDGAYEALGGSASDMMAEKCIDFLMEISVLVARDSLGKTVTFPVGQNIHRNNILHRTLVPAPLEPIVIREAEALAAETMAQMKGTGLFCIEMFVGRNHSLSINEIAPRTHNSGHHTIESCNISQFGQQIRALMGWPLLSPKLFSPAVMVNLLGAPHQRGKPTLRGIEEAMALGTVYPHLYGKAESRPGRKMGHVTILGETLTKAEEIADQVEQVVRIEVEDWEE